MANNGAGVPAPSLCCLLWCGEARRLLVLGCSRRGGGGVCVGDFGPPTPSLLRWCLLRHLRGGVEVSVQECGRWWLPLVGSAVDLRYLGWPWRSWLGLVRRRLPVGSWSGVASAKDGKGLRFSSPALSVGGGEARGRGSSRVLPRRYGSSASISAAASDGSCGLHRSFAAIGHPPILGLW